jgi:hypothetical protein
MAEKKAGMQGAAVGTGQALSAPLDWRRVGCAPDLPPLRRLRRHDRMGLRPCKNLADPLIISRNCSAGGAGGLPSPCRGVGCPHEIPPFFKRRRRRRERDT